jgi:hypothetical protein
VVIISGLLGTFSVLVVLCAVWYDLRGGQRMMEEKDRTRDAVQGVI